MATYTWEEFRAAVASFVTDRQASNTNFTAAVTEFVRARIARDIYGDAALYAVTEKRYTSLRRALAGFTTTLTDVQLQENVRAQLSEGSRSGTMAAQAAAYYMRAELAREIDARGPAEGAFSIAKSCREDYQRLKIRLCGYSTTTQTEAEKYLPVEAVRSNTTDLRASLYAAAIADLAAFGTWIDGQISTAKDDVQALADRVDKELRAGVIDLQRFIRAYQTGHEETFTEYDVTAEGMASAGTLPDGAQVREAYIRYPGATDSTDTYDDDIEDRVNEASCQFVPWEKRFDRMIGSATCGPQIAIDPKGESFLCTPKLEDREIELRIVYDGLKLEFEDDDNVPFDEDAARAVGYKVNAELAAEWGESVAQAAVWAGKYTVARTGLYLKHKRKAEVG